MHKIPWNCFVYTLNLNDKGPSLKWVCFPKSYSTLTNWPWLRISPQSSLFVIYCLILTAWQWLMINELYLYSEQIEPNKSPLRKRLLALLLWETGHLSSPRRSCIGRLILICGGRGGEGAPVGGAPHPWIKPCQTSQQLCEYYSIFENTMDLPSLEELQHRREDSQAHFTRPALS